MTTRFPECGALSDTVREAIGAIEDMKWYVVDIYAHLLAIYRYNDLTPIHPPRSQCYACQGSETERAEIEI
ncbi:hypothetical protein DPMN_054404 [Dreissena polymorpha]|uniref:Uncharacterized protein n=1 Tax=Dreissena polymorpha TaxID=45954 RepID=A0A9D4CNU5_DREPO|nr:hypothetical protein DPMN_054404 [Dreissena polymorpha]